MPSSFPRSASLLVSLGLILAGAAGFLGGPGCGRYTPPPQTIEQARNEQTVGRAPPEPTNSVGTPPLGPVGRPREGEPGSERDQGPLSR